MTGILTVTLNTAIDTTVTIPSTLSLGESHRTNSVLKLPGGKGINVARVLHTLGVPVLVTGMTGVETMAFMTGGLQREGINATFLPIAGAARTCTAIVELGERRVTEINESGPAIEDAEAQAFSHLYGSLLAEANCIVISGSLPAGLPDDYYARLIQQAHDLNIPAILDTSGRALGPGIMARPLLVKPNAAEAREFAGQDVRTVEDAVQVGHSICQRGARMVAMTRGTEGVVLVTEIGAWWARVEVPDALSGVGSGDAFIAGMIGGLYQAAGESVSLAAVQEEAVIGALALAAACGAANTLQLGAGILAREDVQRLRKMVEVSRIA